MRRRLAPSRRRGFTLVELIASATILAALGSVAATIMFTAVDSYIEASASSQLHNEASIAVDRISRELRQIVLDPTAPGIAPDIEWVTGPVLMWNDTSFLFFWSDRLYLREGVDPARILVEDVTAFAVRVFDESDNALSLPRSGAACDPIRRVEITLTVSRSGVTETVRMKQFLRCTMSRAGLP